MKGEEQKELFGVKPCMFKFALALHFAYLKKMSRKTQLLRLDSPTDVSVLILPSKDHVYILNVKFTNVLTHYSILYAFM